MTTPASLDGLRKSVVRSTIAVSLTFSILVACGVRGRPQPPLTPAELGRGKPTYKRATEQFAFPNVPSPAAISPSEPSPDSTPVPSSGSEAN